MLFREERNPFLSPILFFHANFKKYLGVWQGKCTAYPADKPCFIVDYTSSACVQFFVVV